MHLFTFGCVDGGFWGEKGGTAVTVSLGHMLKSDAINGGQCSLVWHMHSATGRRTITSSVCDTPADTGPSPLHGH